MKRVILTILLTTCCGSITRAQTVNGDPYPRLEWFIGASGNHFFYDNSPIYSFPQNLASLFSNHAEGYGVETSLTRNINKYFGVKGDFSIYFDHKPKGDTTTGQDFQVNSKSLYLMAGPEIKGRNHTPVTPFAHALVGVAHSRSEFLVPSINFSDLHTRTGLTLSFGGGLDIRASKRVSIRGMIDYTPTFLSNADPNKSERQNHGRVSLGLLFH